MTEPRPLCIAHVDAERDFSGGEVQVFLLIDGLRALGHRSLLFCPPGSRSAEEARVHGIETRLVRMRSDVDACAVLSLARAGRRCGADVMHLHTGRAAWLGGLAARAAGLPAIATRRMDRRVKRGWRTRLIYGRLVQQVVAISPAVAARLAAAGVPPDRTRLIYSAIEPERLRPVEGRQATRARLGIAADEPVVLALAALVRRKGLDVLLDALALLVESDLRPVLWVAGEGPERAALEGQARRLGLGGQVRFLGRRRDVADLLAAADLLVLPSRREGLGVAVLEAMAAARPVIASAVGGLRDLVADGRTGLLVPAEDGRALAQALVRVLRDGDLRARLGAAARARLAEGFLAEQMVAAYEQLYRAVLAEWNRRAVRRGRA